MVDLRDERAQADRSSGETLKKESRINALDSQSTLRPTGSPDILPMHPQLGSHAHAHATHHTHGRGAPPSPPLANMHSAKSSLDYAHSQTPTSRTTSRASSTDRPSSNPSESPGKVSRDASWADQPESQHQARSSIWRHPGSSSNARGGPTSDPHLARPGSTVSNSSNSAFYISANPSGIPQYPDQNLAALGPSHHHPPPIPTRIGRTRTSHSPNWTHGAITGEGQIDGPSKNPPHSPVGSPSIHSPTPRSPLQTMSRRKLTEVEDIRADTPHSIHTQAPIETHKLNKEVDPVSGRKSLNNYTLLEKLGSGQHGTVKLGRNMANEELVAVKIVRRFSKKRLGKKSDPGDMVKKEVAILKKARHPHVVSLYEVIDDPEFAKVYLVLEYVERGEIIWRKMADRSVALFERARLAREQEHGYDEARTQQDIDAFNLDVPRRRHERKLRLEELRATAVERFVAAKGAAQATSDTFWSLEHGTTDSEHEYASSSRLVDMMMSPPPPQHHQHAADERLSRADLHAAENPGGLSSFQHTRHIPSAISIPGSQSQAATDESQSQPPSLPPSEPSSVPPSQSSSRPVSRPVSPPLVGSMYGSSYADKKTQSDLEFQATLKQVIDEDVEHEWAEEDEDSRHVPCLTLLQCLDAFRDTVLGLEYLHYQGIIHRDIKPANLLWTREYTVKISDFGVSYLGKPVREDSNHNNDGGQSDTEKYDEELELAKTVGTPAFYAPELCDPDLFDPAGNRKRPSITGAIDVWALGITLYGMVFGRLPFFDANEFHMYEKIAHKEVFIPAVRLRGVSHTDRAATSSERDKRPDDILEYETVDDTLRDLLRRLLAKDYKQRISLKEVKHHPWVVNDIENKEYWLDATDPEHIAEGKKIEISTQEVQDAIGNLTVFERVAKGVQRLGSVLRGRGSRKRAESNVTATTPTTATSSSSKIREQLHHSSAGATTPAQDLRRASLKSASGGGMVQLTPSSLSIDEDLSSHLQQHQVDNNNSDTAAGPNLLGTTAAATNAFLNSTLAGATARPHSALDSASSSLNTPRPALTDRSLTTTTTDTMKTVTARDHIRRSSILAHVGSSTSGHGQPSPSASASGNASGGNAGGVGGASGSHTPSASLDDTPTTRDAADHSTSNSSLANLLGGASRRLANSLRGASVSTTHQHRQSPSLSLSSRSSSVDARRTSVSHAASNASNNGAQVPEQHPIFSLSGTQIATARDTTGPSGEDHHAQASVALSPTMVTGRVDSPLASVPPLSSQNSGAAAAVRGDVTPGGGSASTSALASPTTEHTRHTSSGPVSATTAARTMTTASMSAASSSSQILSSAPTSSVGFGQSADALHSAHRGHSHNYSRDDDADDEREYFAHSRGLSEISGASSLSHPNPMVHAAAARGKGVGAGVPSRRAPARHERDSGDDDEDDDNDDEDEGLAMAPV